MTSAMHNSATNRVSLSEKLLRSGRLFEELRDLLFGCSHELAKAGGANWQKAEALFNLAKGADALRENLAGLIGAEQKAGQEAKILPRDTGAVPGPRSEGSNPGAAQATKSARKKKTDYPKYSVRGDLLVKTGLNRDARGEYEHIVPKKEFDAIVAILTEFTTSKKQFAVEDVQARLDCPSYQTYTVLALLKGRGLLVVARRGLYNFKGAKSFPAESANLWDELRSS